MLVWIPLLPLIGFLINGLWYLFFQTGQNAKKGNAALHGTIATLSIAASFVLSLMAFLQLHEMSEEHRQLEQFLFHWMNMTGFNLDMTLRLDSLSTLFTLVITGVGTLIHIYSIGYMGEDETPAKFFCYLNLFCFAMLMLVLGASLPILFLGWEGVGLCSYLLIGYWYTDTEKASAGKKAFVVNRVGDFGFLIGMFLIFTTFGSLDFVAIKAGMGSVTAAIPTITAICLLLFVGCMGKSAQIPLYVWLPDAMAGPTPVSALIHAATMVTSGIYMVARLNFMYSMSPTAMAVVACVGAFTAFFAATIAVAQNDIKKVLAYSTVSQLGYMFLACGVGAYTAGVFHVITHAFFKALLFLGAGSVIHGMHHEQDIQKMGGLKKYMPHTFIVFTIGWFAICGFPPGSGFFSKDEILWTAFALPHGSPLLWGLGALTALMTAFYMTRLWVLTFLGKSRFGHDDHAHDKHAHDKHGHGDHHAHTPHESPWVMVGPLYVLAALSLLGGFMGMPHMSWLEHWLSPVIAHEHELREGVVESTEWILMGVSVAGACLGAWFSWSVFSDLKKAAAHGKTYKAIQGVLANKWYVDELYEAVVVKPIHGLSQFLWKGFDVAVIDRIVNGFGRVSTWTGQTMRVVQTGSIQAYALMILFGIVMIVGYLIYGMA